MENAEPAATLRDTVSAAFDAVESAPPSQVGAEAPSPSQLGSETQEQKDQRARDEAGRFTKAEAAKPDADKVAAPQVPKPANATLSSGAAAPPAPAVAAPTEPPRPQSWKKDYDAHWATLDPALKAYIHQREREYQGGVSTYKAEAENARALNEALAPYAPLMQQHGIEAPALVRNLVAAHERLALGSQQDKVQMGVKLIQDYGIDPQALFQVLSGQQPVYQQAQQQPVYRPQIQEPDIDKLLDAKLMQKEIQNEYQRFLSEAPEKYPHHETVKDTMAGLLQSGLAQDYVSAYEAALRLPKHADIWNAMQEQQRAQAEAAAREKTQATVNGARAKAVSARPATPSGSVSTAKANTSLRDSLSEAFDTVTSSRV